METVKTEARELSTSGNVSPSWAPAGCRGAPVGAGAPWLWGLGQQGQLAVTSTLTFPVTPSSNSPGREGRVPRVKSRQTC